MLNKTNLYTVSGGFLRALGMGVVLAFACADPGIERGPEFRAGDIPEGASCEGFCGGYSDDGCWCDELCLYYGDCCSDKVAVCDGGDSDSDSDSDSGDTTGANMTDGGTTDGDTTAGDTTAGDTTSGGTTGGDTTGGDTTAGDTTGGDTTDEGTTGGDTTSGDTSGGDTSGGDVPDNSYCAPVDEWSESWSAFEDEVLDLVNLERAQGANCGGTDYAPVASITADPVLRCSSRKHSKDMVDRNFFSHTNPDGESSFARMKLAGYSYWTASENIGAGYATPAQVVQGWMKSTGHCKNIMNENFTELGVGYYPGGAYGHYWTLNLGLPQ